MTLLDELKIRNMVIDEEIWISLRDIAHHVLDAVQEFIHESSSLSIVHPVSVAEAAYIHGLAQGMTSVAALLAQAGIEAEFHEKINTVEDLINTFKEKPNGA
jgi:hypothetical protein